MLFFNFIDLKKCTPYLYYCFTYYPAKSQVVYIKHLKCAVFPSYSYLIHLGKLCFACNFNQLLGIYNYFRQEICLPHYKTKNVQILTHTLKKKSFLFLYENIQQRNLCLPILFYIDYILDLWPNCQAGNSFMFLGEFRFFLHPYDTEFHKLLANLLEDTK